MTKLGVNIDHIATLREARKEAFPSPVKAAVICMKAGADGIVAHLREDRRHINDNDIYKIRKAVKRFDMEMASTAEMLRIALKVKPDIVTLVPEKRIEVTTEGGLNVKAQKKYLTGFVKKLQDAGIIVSLFIDPDEEQIKAAADTGAMFVEIHTGEYARKNPNDKIQNPNELKKIQNSVRIAKKSGLSVNAGHGLTLENAGAVAGIKGVEELNIGFSIIADAVFNGLESTVRRFVACIK